MKMGLGMAPLKHLASNWLPALKPSYSLRHNFANFSIGTFKPHHVICTAAVRTWAKFQIASVNESEDRDV